LAEPSTIPADVFQRVSQIDTPSVIICGEVVLGRYAAMRDLQLVFHEERAWGLK